MGNREDVTAEVDQKVKVKGMKGLRVDDASAILALVGGNTNAPTIMIAEHCAELTKQDYQ